MLQSYLNDPELKKAFVAEIIKHRKADQVIKGTYGDNEHPEKGFCAVGCSIHSLNKILKKKTSTNNHKAYESLIGVPEWLAHLEDTIFEGLPDEEAEKWPEQFAKAIPVGVDLDPVKWKFSAFILKENIERVLTLNISDDLKKQVVDSIRQVLNVHEVAIKTGEWNSTAAWSAWSAARSAWSAWSAWSAESAARSAAASAARSAESAARSAWSARSAAASAAESARSAESAARSAESAARSASYSRYAKALLKLLKAVRS